MKEVDETANLVVGVLKCSRAGDTDGRTGQIQVPDPIDVTEVGEREPRRVPADDTDQGVDREVVRRMLGTGNERLRIPHQ